MSLTYIIMVTSKEHFYRHGVALLIWLQLKKCFSTKYDIDVPEMEFLASKLSPQECYEFYNHLSHRKSFRGELSIYPRKEKMHRLSCTSLLTTWLTDPDESSFRSHENIETKLRYIGRKDLARWVLRKIESTLERKIRMDDEQSNRRNETSEYVGDGKLINTGGEGIIVVDRLGGKIMPRVSPDDRQTRINGENFGVDDKDNACVLGKIFFSTVAVLLLILLFACFYRFLYTKLRCINRRFGYSESRNSCFPEQKYGTASNSDSSVKKTRRTWNYDHCSAHNCERSNTFTSANESNEETFVNTNEEAKSLLVESTNETTKKRSSTNIFSTNSEVKYFQLKTSDEKVNFKELMIKNSEQNCRIRDKFVRSKIPFDSRSERMVNWERCGRRKLKKIDFNRSERTLIRSFPDVQRKFPESTISRISVTKETKYNATEIKKVNSNSKQSQILNFENKDSKWICCSCNELSQSERKFPSPPKSIDSNEKPKNSKSHEQKISKFLTNNYLINSRGDGDSEMSDTYNELGMLFSEELKRQWRPCRRKYCPLSRNLGTSGKVPEHDVKKCRARVKSNFFGYRVIKFDERPACSSAEICRDTYDEFELMRVTRGKREDVARSIINRRKQFLDQPCLSPIAAEKFLR